VNKYGRVYWSAVLALLSTAVVWAADLEAGVPLQVREAALQQVPEAAEAGHEMVEPEYVRALSALEAGRNDSNPVWSANGSLIAFERSRGDKREIVIARTDGAQLYKIYFQISAADEKENKDKQFFLPGFAEEPSYNTGVSWARDSKRVAFMSNGGEGNYDIYSQILGGNAQRLTDHKEKDGLAQWSPVADQLVFVSGRSGKGDAYLLDPATRAVTQLTRGDKPYLYPRWSPDGKKIALIYGSTENHGVYVMDDPKKPAESLRALTRWAYDDLRPAWSPDGRKIAFYTNYNAAGDPKIWSLAVVAADGSDGISGDALAQKIVATDVVPDVEQGPAWLADGRALVYVKDEKLEYNPIYMVDLASRKSVQLKTGTKMNHDVACGPNGLIAFRAQVDQWDQIFIAKLKNK
jgi:Tol biopolymer transport system component